MSTNSVVASPSGDGWRGRYCHSDGYPSYNGRVLHALVSRDGLEVVRRTLIEAHYGWSLLDPDRIDLTGVKPDGSAPYRSPAYTAFQWQYNNSDGGYENVPGYGIAYTDTKITTPPLGTPEEPYQQATDDEVITSAEIDDWYWVYVLADHALIVIAGGKHIAEVAWSAPEVDWAEIECGKRLERCSHVEGYHDKQKTA